MSAFSRDNFRILITGRDGQVGRELARVLPELGKVTATNRQDLDLASDSSIRQVVRDVRPALIVNAAAYTAVDRAESEPALANRINAEAVATLASAAREAGAAIIHYSTDYVFDGEKSEPYIETDMVHPLNVYGRTKLAGEQALSKAQIPYLILRTSWVYGAEGKNFLLTILRLASEKPELRIVDDQKGAPTWSRDIATATASIVKQWQKDSCSDQQSGVYHMTASDVTSWYGFASEAIRLRLQSDPARHLADLLPISSAEYPTPAKRPRNSQLHCEKLARVFGYRLPGWKASLNACIRAI